MINDDYIQTLMDFGLSFLQSKVYLTIVKLQKANIKTISRASTIARQDIYRIMPALLQKGLVEKIVTRPTTYNATPLELGISILLEKKKDECIDLEKKQVWLLKNFNSSKPNRNSLEDSTNFKITSEITLLLKMHKELIQKATETIDAVIPFIPSTADISEELIYLFNSQLIKGSVNTRLITSKLNKPIWSDQEFTENTWLDVRYMVESIPFGMHIFDKQEVTLSLSIKNGLPCLWSNNSNVLILAQNYFDLLWKIAEKI